MTLLYDKSYLIPCLGFFQKAQITGSVHTLVVRPGGGRKPERNHRRVCRLHVCSVSDVPLQFVAQRSGYLTGLNKS